MSSKQTRLAFVAVLCAMILNGPLALARTQGHAGTGTPPGFSKGQKKGWQGGTTPPGWAKGKKKGWDEAGMPPGLKKKASPLTSTTSTTSQPSQPSQPTQS